MLHAIGKALLSVLGGAVILATLLPLLRSGAWWVRVFDFPRAQIFFVGVAVFIATFLSLYPLSVGRAFFLLLLTVSLFYQGWCIFPYTALAKEQVRSNSERSGNPSVRVMVANVLMTNRNAQGLRQLVEKENPDFLLAVETDRWWEENLRPLERFYPFTLKRPQNDTYGMLLYSRHPLREAEIHFLVQEEVPSFRVQIRLVSGHLLDLWGVHPKPPVPGESFSSTTRDAELLLVGRAVKDLERPVIIAGDLNDVAWSRTTRLFQKVSGLLDPRIGRGRFSTFHARYPLLRWPLDHVFHSNHFRLVELRLLPGFGSDHFPILVALSFEPQGRSEQEEPRGDGKEHAEAQEKIQEGIRDSSP